MHPKFIYFDIGNVLLRFSNRLGCEQIARLMEVDPERVWEVIFETGLAWRFERGELSGPEFHSIVCKEIGRTIPLEQMALASSDIFVVNASIKPIVAQLALAGYRLGLLSNTNEWHWDFFTDGRYKLLPEAFEVHTLSFRVGAMKPEAKIYEAAAELAGVRPQELFFVDDVEVNVAGAREAGIDAVQYHTTWQLAQELRRRDVRFNY